MPPKSRSKVKSGLDQSPNSVLCDMDQTIASLKQSKRDISGEFNLEDAPEGKK